MCHGAPCDLPGCSYRPGPGMGLRKANPAKRGDTAREAAYRKSHRRCEAAQGCSGFPLHLHHVDRRQNRATSRLLMVCPEHHAAIHAGLLDDGRRA